MDNGSTDNVYTEVVTMEKDHMEHDHKNHDQDHAHERNHESKHHHDHHEHGQHKHENDKHKESEHHKHYQQRKSHMHHKLKNYKKHIDTRFDKIVMGFSVLVLVLVFIGLIQSLSLGSLVHEKIAEAKEAARPASISMITVNAEGCDNCFDIGKIVDYVKGKNVNVTDEKSLSFKDSADIISKYNLDKIPTVIVTGETDKLNLRDFEKREDALVFTGVKAPFVDAKSGNVMGNVEVTLVEQTDCDICVDMSSMVNGLRSSEVVVSNFKKLSSDDSEALDIIEKYNVKKLPFIVLSEEIDAYPEVVSQLESSGFVNKDGRYVLEAFSAPYFNLSSVKIEGIVKVIYILDESCKECYDPVDLHRPIMQRLTYRDFGEQTFDVGSAEGKRFVEMYNITKIPTIIVQGDTSLYPVLVNVWNQVGTVDEDGSMVFRNMEAIRQTYKDLSSGEIINQQAS